MPSLKKAVLALSLPCLAGTLCFSTKQVNHFDEAAPLPVVSLQSAKEGSSKEPQGKTTQASFSASTLHSSAITNKTVIQQSLSSAYKEEKNTSDTSSSEKQPEAALTALGAQMIAEACKTSPVESAAAIPEFSSASEGIEVFQSTGSFKSGADADYTPKEGDIVFLNLNALQQTGPAASKEPTEDKAQKASAESGENESSSADSGKEPDAKDSASGEKSGQDEYSPKDSAIEKKAEKTESRQQKDEDSSFSSGRNQEESESEKESSSSADTQQNSGAAQTDVECGIFSGLDEQGNYRILIAQAGSEDVELKEVLIPAEQIIGFGSLPEAEAESTQEEQETPATDTENGAGKTENKASETQESPAKELTLKELIWNALLAQGYTSVGAAGIMGNFQQESHNSPGTVQKGFGWSDEEYVAKIQDGTISKEDFMHDQVGFGLAQWTSAGRKERLYDYGGAENIADLSSQLGFFQAEMQLPLYKELDAWLKNPDKCTDIEEAARRFHDVYERSADTDLTRRINYAKAIFKEFASQSEKR